MLHDPMGDQQEHDPPETKPGSGHKGPSLDELLARAVADKLESDPELAQIPLENIERWLARGALSNPDAFRRWRELLDQAREKTAALRQVLELLRAETEEARGWRDFSPFAGVLSAEERRAVIRRCNYSH